MKNVLVVAVAVLLAAVAAPAQAEDGKVSQATLSALGLGAMQAMSDTEGAEIRGMQSGFASVHGASLIVGQLATADFKNFVVGSSGNQVAGNAETTASGITILAKEHNVELALALQVDFPDGSTFAGALAGAAGGVGSVTIVLP